MQRPRGGNKLTNEQDSSWPYGAYHLSTVLSSIVATSHMWLCKLIKVKYNLKFNSSVILQVLNSPCDSWLLYGTVWFIITESSVG